MRDVVLNGTGSNQKDLWLTTEEEPNRSPKQVNNQGLDPLSDHYQDLRPCRRRWRPPVPDSPWLHDEWQHDACRGARSGRDGRPGGFKGEARKWLVCRARNWLETAKDLHWPALQRYYT